MTTSSDCAFALNEMRALAACFTWDRTRYVSRRGVGGGLQRVLDHRSPHPVMVGEHVEADLEDAGQLLAVSPRLEMSCQRLERYAADADPKHDAMDVRPEGVSCEMEAFDGLELGLWERPSPLAVALAVAHALDAQLVVVPEPIAGLGLAWRQ